MEERKIIIERKKRKQGEKSRTLVEMDNDVHAKLSEISSVTGRPIREIASILLRDALKYVEIK